MSESRSTRPVKPVHFKKKALIAAIAVLPFIAVAAFPTPRTLTTYGIQIKMPEAVAMGEEDDIESATPANSPATLIVASNSDIAEKTAALSYHSGDPISEDDLQTAGQTGDQPGVTGFGETTQDQAVIGETGPGFDFGAPAFSGGNSGSGFGHSGIGGGSASSGSAQSGSTGGQQVASIGPTSAAGGNGSTGGTGNSGGGTGNTGSTGGNEPVNTGGGSANNGPTGGNEPENTGGGSGNNGSTGGNEPENTGGGSANNGSTGGNEPENTGGGSAGNGPASGDEPANTGGGSAGNGPASGDEPAITGGESDNGGSSGPTVINDDPEEVIIAGLFKPGHSPGEFVTDGDLTYQADAITEIEIGGLEAVTEYDQVRVGGLLSLDGILKIILYPTDNAFIPSAGDSFKIFTFGSLAGSFKEIIGLDIGEFREGCSFQYVTNAHDITLVTQCADLQTSFLSVGQLSQVPEPGMLVIFGLGLVGMGVIRRRRRA